MIMIMILDDLLFVIFELVGFDQARHDLGPFLLAHTKPLDFWLDKAQRDFAAHRAHVCRHGRVVNVQQDNHLGEQSQPETSVHGRNERVRLLLVHERVRRRSARYCHNLGARVYYAFDAVARYKHREAVLQDLRDVPVLDNRFPLEEQVCVQLYRRYSRLLRHTMPHVQHLALLIHLLAVKARQYAVFLVPYRQGKQSVHHHIRIPTNRTRKVRVYVGCQPIMAVLRLWQRSGTEILGLKHTPRRQYT
ncbi:hypothetical protein AYI70_g3121 [Smittium culicis]|uniref:Secreted protein n=1 Tax=Smittium culicis TaxID=133412 RepID=A0A1R1Y4X3_9FUNG|nr:hypothetical protein AYI70_g3121 [Smittium culicis]